MANTVDKVINVARAEVGYLEKKSNAWLNSKTKNAGNNNYTKYGKYLGMNGVYWCAEFVSWIFCKAYGKENAKKLLGGGISASCEVIRQQYVKKGKYHTNNPKSGDVIFFKGKRHSGANHIGIVYKVDSNRVYTIEGNTSGGSFVIDNGGGVAYKSYKLSYSEILGYGRPKYDVKKEKVSVAKPTLKQGMSGHEIKVLQKNLNSTMDAHLEIDGIFGSNTEKVLSDFKVKYRIGANGKSYGDKSYEKMKALLK